VLLVGRRGRSYVRPGGESVKDNLVLIPAAPFVEVEPCSFFYCRRAHDPSVRFWNR
jgi:hypothetical protein